TSMNTDVTAQDLATAISSIPGVRGIEPGITSTLRTLDARLRRTQNTAAHYGVIMDPASSTVTIEVALEMTATVRSIVEDIQRTVQHTLASTTSDPEALTEGSPSTTRQWNVLVRVQSLTTSRSRHRD